MSQEALNPDNSGNIRDEKGRFVAGTSGNPAGRPVGSLSITGEIKKKLQEVPKGEKVAYLEKLIDRIIEMALSGDQQMIKHIWMYVDGLPKQNAEKSDAPTVLIIDQ